MIVIILVTILVTVATLLISSVLYFVTVIVRESDDTGSSDTLALDEREFSTTPTTSPACENPQHHHHEELSPVASTGFRVHFVDHQDTETIGNDLASVATVTTPQLEPSAEGVETKQSVQQNVDTIRSTEQRVTRQVPQPPTQSRTKEWPNSATTQKSLITDQLGAPACKQLFEEFDPKEMQLGGTGLHWCSTRKSLDKLVKLGLPLNVENKRRETALHVAVRKRRLPVLIGLLCHGADVDHRNELGETPLIVACRINDIFACQALLVFDSDIDARDKHGFSSRHYVASSCDKHKIQQRLPSASHLILAMLNEMGAKRCTTKQEQKHRAAKQAREGSHLKNTRSSSSATCTDGCSPDGAYNGNSYNRWPDYKKESLYKRHMFTDIIAELQRNSAEARTGNQADTSNSESPAGQTPVDGQQRTSPRSTRMLCIDGGGMRGVIVCQIMIELEKHLKQPMLSYFDWIGGTSVGAFLACAMCVGVSLKKLRRICFDVKDEVFSGNKPYNSKFLERVLKRTYGQSTRMSDVKYKKLAIATVIADRDPCQLRFFRNYKSPAQLLELYGYAVDVYDIVSAHSIVPRQDKAPNAVSKSAVKSTSSKSTISVVSEKISSPNINPSQPPAASHANGATASKTLKSVTTTKATETQKKQHTRSPTKALKTTNQIQLHQQHLQKLKHDSIVMKSNDDSEILMDDNNPRNSINDDTLIIDEDEQDPLVWQAVRASAAAPFFFKPYGPYLDGGIISNNPTLDVMSEFYAYERVKYFLRSRINTKIMKNPMMSKDDRLKVHEEPPSKLSLVLSLGTGRGRVVGHQAMIDFGNVASGLATVFSPVELLRSIRAARDLFKKLMHRSCMTDDHILDRAQAWCSSLNIPYFRISPPLANIFSIDDKRDEQLVNALWQTKLYMRAMRPQLEQLSNLLDNSSPMISHSQQQPTLSKSTDAPPAV